MIRRFALMPVLGAAMLALGLGCNTGFKKVDVKVTYDGQPLDGAMVVFTSDTGQLASGLTDAAGVCTLKSGNNKEGVPPGTYAVTISKIEKPAVDAAADPKAAMDHMKNLAPKPGAAKAGPGMPPGGPGAAPPGGITTPKNLIPAKYNDPKTSGFSCKVPEDTSGVKEFALTSK